MKGCVIGNSHLAALKLGWAKVASEYPDLELHFYGSHRDSMMRTDVRDGRLVALDAGVRSKLQMTGGSPDIDLASYDFFAIAGMGFGLHPALALLDTHAIPPLDIQDRQTISVAAFSDAMCDMLRGSTAGHIYWLLYTNTPAPIFILPQPLSAEGILSAPRRSGIYSLIRNASLEKTIADIFSAASLAALSGHTDIVHQPRETVTSEIYTKSMFSDGSVRLNQSLDKQHSESDFFHMNDRYGALMLRELVARVAAAQIAPRSPASEGGDGAQPAVARREMAKPVPASALVMRQKAERKQRRKKRELKRRQAVAPVETPAIAARPEQRSGEAKKKKPKSLWRRLKRRILRRDR